MAADVLDLLGDGEGGAGRRALERHVLEQMGDAVDSRPARGGAPALDPDADATPVSALGIGSVATRRPFGERGDLDGSSRPLQRARRPRTKAWIASDIVRQHGRRAPARRYSRPAAAAAAAARRSAASTASGNLAGCAVPAPPSARRVAALAAAPACDRRPRCADRSARRVARKTSRRWRHCVRPRRRAGAVEQPARRRRAPRRHGEAAAARNSPISAATAAPSRS